MKELYKKSVNALKSKVKHSTEEVPRGMGLRAIGIDNTKTGEKYKAKQAKKKKK